jgi:hypothetical protein
VAVVAAVLALAALGIASGRVPVRSIVTFLQFKLRPDRARTQHLARLQHPATGQIVHLLGTTHHHHYKDDAYSIWHVKAAVLGLGVQTVFIEVMPEAVRAGRLGEGPVEMPFVGLAAQEAGLVVHGMDSGWEGGWRGRQDRMFAAIQERLATSGNTLVVSGFMHLRSFQEQLQGEGFAPVPWTEAERNAVFETPVEKTWPRGLRASLEQAIAAARTNTEPDQRWFIAIREEILELMAKDGC